MDNNFYEAVRDSFKIKQQFGLSEYVSQQELSKFGIEIEGLSTGIAMYKNKESIPTGGIRTRNMGDKILFNLDDLIAEGIIK